MSPRYTWLWATLALGLFAFIFFFERHWRAADTGPLRVLPGLDVASVTSVQVRPVGQLEIRAERTNGMWWLTRPIHYPGEAWQIETLLTNLAQLQVQTHITAADLRQRTNTDEEFGFDAPQASLLIQERDTRHQLLVGARTPPGDQVYLQVVGVEGLYVVHADLLERIPRSPNAWREIRFVNLDGILFDRILVTNAGAAFELRWEAPGQFWRLAEPLQARAETARIEAALLALQRLPVTQFVTDDLNADTEGFGLQPPEMTLTLARQTNSVLQLQVGRSPTNDARQVFARRRDRPAIVTVPRELLSPWRVAYSEFRDRHLLNLTRPVQSIEVAGDDAFALTRVSSNAWRLLPLDLPADTGLAEDLISALGNLQITQFVKDVVIEPDLPQYGLATPVRKFTLRSAADGGGGDTNGVLGGLEFGATQDDRTFVRRPDETSVYAVKTTDFQRLHRAAFQLRERRIWNHSEANIASLAVEQGGRTRRLVRQHTNSWSLAAGSQGIIDGFAVEETAHRLGQLYAINWVAHGEPNLARFGFTPEGLKVTLELNSGDKLSVRFGGTAPSGVTYAATELEGQVWIFECPPAVSELVRAYLSVPAGVP